ncbi:MAG: hypothetical protein IJ365_06155, partial [Clostridia bacterium]|nr:hypothetical protein [Clostridia bacterium]
MQNVLKNKRFILNIFSVLLFCAILFRLVSLQIVMGESYREQSENRLVSQEVIEAPRGVIMDRNGKPLVTNKQGFSVEISKSDMSYDQLNDIILKTVNLLDELGQKYTDTLPVSKNNFDFTYNSYDGEERSSKIAEFKQSIQADQNATGLDCVKLLAQKYEIDSRYSDSDLRKIVGIRYEMENRGFGTATPYTIAQDVSLETVSRIEEGSNTYKNVKITTRPVRQYHYEGVASHILGRVGIIYKEEYEQLKESNYGMNDMIGKDGLEKSLEKYLKGENGMKNTSRSLSSTTGFESADIPAKVGNNVVLTLDIDLQQTAEKALKDTIAQIKINGLKKENKAGADAGGGAVVVT